MGTICLPATPPPHLRSRACHSFRLALTSRLPTVSCVGRSSAIGTGFSKGSRAIGKALCTDTRLGRTDSPPRDGQNEPEKPRLPDQLTRFVLILKFSVQRPS